MSSDFNNNFGFVVEEIFEHGHIIKSGCFDTQNSYSASGVNSHRIISTKIEVRTLREYSIFVQKCEAILNNVLLLFWTHSLSFGIISKPRLTGTVVQNTRNSVIKNSWIINTFNIYKKIIETSPEYFSILIFGREHQVSFTMFWFCTNCTNFVSLTGTIFQKLHTRQSNILFVFPRKFPFEPAEMSV